MNRALHSQPARILKRAEVGTAFAHVADAAASTATPASTGASAAHRDAAERHVAPRARAVAKEARLVSSAEGKTTVEVRCACGEWTRIELCAAETEVQR